MSLKKIILLLFIFHIFIFSIFADETKCFEQKMLLEGHWTVSANRNLSDFYSFRIIFADNNSYRFYSSLERFELAKGTYSMTTDGIILNLPDTLNFNGGECLFQNESNSIQLFYSQETNFYHIDEDFLRCQNNDLFYIHNSKNKKITPLGTKCFLDGIEVIKINKKYTPTENIKIRKKPDNTAETEQFNYTSYLYFTFKTKLDEKGYTIVENPKYCENDSNFSKIFKGMVVKAEAETVKEQTIDGITAPWYFISLYDKESIPISVWIFGGYVRQTIQQEDNFDILVPELIAHEIIIKK